MQTKNSKKHTQYKSRPRIEDFISSSDFDGGTKSALLGFAAYLRADKMPPQWAAINSWKFLYKKERIGYIRLIDGAWFFDYIIPKKEKDLELYRADLAVDESFEEYAIGENLVAFIREKFKYCTGCTSVGHCSPKSMTIFGEDYRGICWNGNLSFKNPNATDLERLKKLYDYLKNGVAPRGGQRKRITQDFGELYQDILVTCRMNKNTTPCGH